MDELELKPVVDPDDPVYIKCKRCGLEFVKKGTRVYCGAECAGAACLESVSDPIYTKMSTSRIGAWGESTATAYFLQKGYSVFGQVNPDAPFDLVVFDGNRTIKVEVRTGSRLKDDRIQFPTSDRDWETE